MATPVLTDDQITWAKRQRALGVTDTAIAAQLHVSVRTVRRWLGPRRNRLKGLPGYTPRPFVAEWPAERLFPSEWTAPAIAERTGWPEDFSRRMAAAALRTQAQGRRWMPWFIRSFIEQMEAWNRGTNRLLLTEWSVWVDLLAGLPILAEWLDESACLELRDLVVQYRPYEARPQLLAPLLARPTADQYDAPEQQSDNEPDIEALEVQRIDHPVEVESTAVITETSKSYVWERARKGYAAAARIPVAAIRQRVDELSIASLLNLPQSMLNDPYAALMELVARLPMFDIPESDSEHWYELPGMHGNDVMDTLELAGWQLFMRVFMHDPEDVLV